MRSENHSQLNDLIALLSPVVPQNLDSVQKEPRTYHRRGHWFKSSIAHHSISLHNSGAVTKGTAGNLSELA